MDAHDLVSDTLTRIADSLEDQPDAVWDQPSLCTGWRVREVVAHVTMPARMDDDQFAQQMAAMGGDFQRFSDHTARRDGSLPVGEHLANLRSARLAAWEPPGGGARGALHHAVVHGLDITNAVGLDRACSDEAALVVLDGLTDGGAAQFFGTELTGMRLVADDLDWSWGEGRTVAAPAGELISLICHRELPDGRSLR
jgi:uncharacterized protein (TIGR03083 family)